MPTIGRVDEVQSFILSVKNEKANIRLFISDQNEVGFLNPDKLYTVNENLSIRYFHSNQKGLSYNRNFLLNKLDNEEGVIAFPDDDCLYYNDTLERVELFFKNNPEVDVLLGCIYDRQTKKYLFKNWPQTTLKVNHLNVYFLSSSITIFVRKPNSQLFDERLGAGADFGSCEDPDYLYNLLRKGHKIIYDPSVQVWHPAPDYNVMSLNKVHSYAKGFGYFIRKDIDFYKIILLLLLIIKKICQLVFKFGKFQKKYFSVFFSGLFSGLLGKST